MATMSGAFTAADRRLRPRCRGGNAKPPARRVEGARRAERCLSELAQGPGPALPCAAARVLARKAPREAIATLIAYVPFADDEGVQEAVFEALALLAPPSRGTRASGSPDDSLLQ